MALEKYRKGVSELNTEMQIAYLHQMIQFLAMSVRQAMPMTPNLDMILNGQSYIPAPTSHGPPMQLDGHALLTGRGPRFVAMYNLAQSDAERQALLDSLPSLAAPSGNYYWNFEKYFHEYRLNEINLDGYGSTQYAKEWKELVANLHQDERAIEFTGALDEYFAQLKPFHELIQVGEDQPTILRLIGKDNARTHLFLLPVREINGYYVIGMRTYNDNGRGAVTGPDNNMTVRWSDHECCWASTQGLHGPQEAYERTVGQFAEWMGMPAYEPCDPADFRAALDAMPAKIQEIWKGVDVEAVVKGQTEDDENLDTVQKKFAGKIVITVPNVLMVEITIPRQGYYDHHKFHMRPLDGDDNMASRHVGLRCAKETSSSWNELQSIVGSESNSIHTTGIPRRQWKRMTSLMQQFIAFESPTIVCIPNESY